jgi:hypothetical protein
MITLGVIECTLPFGASAPGSLRSPSEGGLAPTERNGVASSFSKAIAGSSAWPFAIRKGERLPRPSLGERRLPAQKSVRQDDASVWMGGSR